MINKFRRLLIQIGKLLPFVICSLVFINYAETAFALATNDFLVWNSMVVPNTQLSFIVGLYFEYNLQMLLVLAIISIAIETCVYNKMACAYLAINLFEKFYFNFELEPINIYIICIANMVVSGILTFKGIKIIIN